MTALILRPSSFNELAQFSTMAAKSSMVPPGFRGKPEDIMLAVQMGSEVGLSPMQALQNIAVINNRPSLWGDAMLGLCRAAAVCEDIAEKIEGEGDAMAAVCMAKRRGSSPVVARFSVADAKKAGLWNKAGPWQQYPQRMLQMRARGFALRDAFPDVLRGLISAEEAQDTPPPVAHSGPTIEVRAEVVTDPAEPPKRTLGQFLDELEIKLRAAPDYVAVMALVESPEVRRAQDKAQNGSAQRLADMIEAAQARVTVATAQADDDGWPGPVVEAAQ
jgi:hypothetical protein